MRRLLIVLPAVVWVLSGCAFNKADTNARMCESNADCDLSLNEQCYIGFCIAAADGGGTGGSGGSGGSGGTGASGGTGGANDSGVDSAVLNDGSVSDAGDASSGECSAPTECATLYGVAPCGAWQCNGGQCEVICANCIDADLDGYGNGSGCAAADCDDADDSVVDAVATSACYSGASGTETKGTCRAGTRSCAAGVWTPCAGEVTPSGEACNAQDDDCDDTADEDLGAFNCGIGACARSARSCNNGALGVCAPGSPTSDNNCDAIDNDCDGAVDENCLANCVWVSPNGDDGDDGSIGSPFATIQVAIANADTSLSQRVCVAVGTACNTTYTYNQDVTMRSGVSVFGSYETNTPSRCPTVNTRIAPSTPTGVLFGATITAPTTLDGFRVIRAAHSTTAAITIDGATNVTISDIEILPLVNSGVQNSYGIDLKNGATALITGMLVYGGDASQQAYGIRSIGATPTIRDNCNGYDGQGRCNINCGWTNATNKGIRGRLQGPSARSHAVYLENSPNAVVERSSLCHNGATDGAAIYVTGDATGLIVRANFVEGASGTANSHGIWMQDCGNAAPWIVDNFQIIGESGNPAALVDGIRSIGACHPVIDQNQTIAGGSEGGATDTNGIYCGANSNGASNCVILGNSLIQGSLYGFPPRSVGVRCDDDACMRVANNVIDGRGGVETYGLWLQQSGTFVDDNVIRGGCGSTRSIGVFAEDSFARIQNNRIHGGSQASCRPNTAFTADPYGMLVRAAVGNYELDVHSNVIDGDGAGMPCDGYGLYFDVMSGAPGPKGVYRNNIILPGMCSNSRHDAFEALHVADPRVFENNDLSRVNGPTSVYTDPDIGALTSASAVNALADATFSGNIDDDPQFMTYPVDLHQYSSSACDGAGTPAGAPVSDMDGQTRDTTTPDIGPDEF